MNHFKMSVLKSILRIGSCLTAAGLALANIVIPALVVAGVGLAVAEVLGILEEVFDKRKEK